MNTGDSDDIRNSDDPLPEGWTVKVKVRPSGKKDKCYFPPSGEGKFYSKLEVVRHLYKNNPKSEEKEKGIEHHSSQNVTLEKSEPEGLPPGWTKEIKVTKKGYKIRRDPYYTDPVSGYVFRSMKDALRYLETGELGRLALKPKDNSSNNLELEDDKACSPAAAKKQKLEVNRTTSPIISDQSSKLFEVTKDKHALSPAGSGESMPVSERKSGNCEVGSESNSSGVQEDKDFNQKVGQNDPDKSVVATAGVALSNEHSLESETTKNETKSTALGKSKKKKDLNLPRRASKRLAGLPLDPTPELKITNRARRAAVKQSSDEESTGRDSSHAKLEAKHAYDNPKNTKRSLESNMSTHPIRNLAASHDPVGKVETEKRGSEKPEYASVSSLENLLEMENKGNAKHGNAVVSENAGKMQTDNNDDEKLQLQLDLPLGELWQDPCIAFAIKTLTGISFDNTDSVQVSSGSNNSDFRGLTSLEEDHGRKDAQNGSLRQQGCTVVEPLNNLGTREHVGGLEISNKDDGKPGSPLNLPFADAWADPCIEFAIKTLTGAIPLDYDVVIQDCFQHKASSSQSQESSGLILHNVGETGQSQIFCPQFGIQERPLYNQGALVEPGLRRSKNLNVGYSDATIHLQHSEERSKESQR